MSKTITVPEADIQALRVAQFTIKTGDPADDRAAASAFERRLLGGLGIERKAEPLASIEQPVNVVVHNHAGDTMPRGEDVILNVLRANTKAIRRGRPRKQRP